MKKNRIHVVLVPVAAAFTLLVGCTTAPDVTSDGLVKVESPNADLVYILPNANLDHYTKILLLEPEIAFRSDFESDNAFKPFRSVDSSTMKEMINTGKQLLVEEFTKELKKGGYEIVSEPGDDVLAVKAAIKDLYIDAPDANNMAGMMTSTYSRDAGSAKLQLDLYDSVTNQKLLEATDEKDNRSDGYSWRFERTQASNINDARYALNSWAQSFVDGLKRAKATPVIPPPSSAQ